MKLILLRHGESQWNLENRFTGWKDVPLTSNGIQEAKFSGNQLVKNNIKIDTIYSSLLERAIHTADIVAGIIGFNTKSIKYNWRLNERHYGALQGLTNQKLLRNLEKSRLKFGEEVMIYPHLYYLKMIIDTLNSMKNLKILKKIYH